MNPLTPENLIAFVLPGLEGISLDVYTAIAALLGIILIMVGLDLLKDILLRSIGSRREKDISTADQGEDRKRKISRFMRG